MSKFFKALQQAEEERGLRPRLDVDRLEARSGAADVGVMQGNKETSVPRSRSAHGGEGVDEHLVSLLRPSSFEAEQYRMLSHLVERLRGTSAVKVVGIASPSPGDGKSVTAINLAGALAQDHQSRVLVLEADLRQPVLARYLSLPDSERGLTQLIAQPGLILKQAVTRLSGVHFDVLTAGHQSSAPYDVLRSSKVEDIFQAARQAYDYVVVDTPPLVGVPEAPLIERMVDGLFVVVRAHRTLRTLLEEGLRLVDPAKVLGLVFNGDDHFITGSERYARYWGRDLFRNGHGNR